MENVEDSMKLGQFLVFCDMVEVCTKHPNFLVQAGSWDEKYPKYLATDLPFFRVDGLYVIKKSGNK
jgi:hypothetical protein